jgi:hypothetical protein
MAQNSQMIFDQYLKVKDALVQADTKAATTYSFALEKAIKATDSFEGKKEFQKAAYNLAKERGIEKQRLAFANVSTMMWAFVNNSKDINRDVYYQYCPMKKTYWLSTEADIKNPYYGAQMLTCGNVADKKIR